MGELRGLSEMSLSQVMRACSITSQKSNLAGRRCLVLLSLLIVFVSYTFGSNNGGRTLLSPADILLSHSIIGRLDSCSGCSVYVEALHLLTVTSPLSDWMYIPVFSPGLLHSSWVLGERLSLVLI